MGVHWQVSDIARVYNQDEMQDLFRKDRFYTPYDAPIMSVVLGTSEKWSIPLEEVKARTNL